MKSEFNFSNGNKLKIYGSLGIVLGVLIFASMILLPDVWRAGLYTAIGVFGVSSSLFLWRRFYLMDHERKMLAIARIDASNKAQLLPVQNGGMIYDAGSGRLISATMPQLTAGGENIWEIYYERKEGKTGAIKRGSVYNIEASCMQQFAQSVLNGRGFTEDNARKFNITQKPFTDWRDEAIKDGLIRWKSERDHNLGLELSDEFMELLHQFATTPLP